MNNKFDEKKMFADAARVVLCVRWSEIINHIQLNEIACSSGHRVCCIIR